MLALSGTHLIALHSDSGCVKKKVNRGVGLSVKGFKVEVEGFRVEGLGLRV